MSLDRRIVSILYYNNIFDVNEVEEFIGEKNNFYEIKIGGKIKKLEIPSKEYDKDIELDNDFLLPTNGMSKEEAEINLIELMDDDIPEIESQFDVVVDAIKENRILKVTESFEDVLEKTEIEKKNILEKSKKANPKISSKKIQIVDSKKIDDDLDDFINIL